ncbi:hypothetical protein HU200_047512 [Digitaria exilis]|uniref:ARM repeat superfamily protein n=1 Tax=Digitaria exilis TaxID=1010633 RepID=A0A835AUF5_9POAL|nr:hypothetical protein HU200_047512 [Digitaria exilis]
MPFAAAAHPERSVLRGRRRRKSAASKQERRLNGFVRFVAFGEWTGNAFGTLAFLWATVVLLGGYCKDLNHVDFWCATAIIFIEAFRMFSRNYRLDDQSLFRTTRAIRAISSPFARMLVRPQEWNELAAIMGLSIYLICFFLPQLLEALDIYLNVLSILMAAFIVCMGKLQFPGAMKLMSRPRRYRRLLLWAVLVALLILAALLIRVLVNQKSAQPLDGLGKVLFGDDPDDEVVLNCALQLAAILELVVAVLLLNFRPPSIANLTDTPCGRILLCLSKVILVMNWLDQFVFFYTPITPSIGSYIVIMAQYINFLCLPFATMVVSLGSLEIPANSPSSQLIDITLHIFFFGQLVSSLVMIGLNLVATVTMLVALLISNLQIPAGAVTRIVISSLCLGSVPLLPKYKDDKLARSIVAFYVLTLCQGTLNIVACVSDLFSFFLCRSLARQSGLRGKRGARAVDLYYHNAYLKCMETGILATAKEISLASFAIESLSSSSHKAQLAGVLILDSLLQEREELISRIACSSKAVSALIAMLGRTEVQDRDIRLFAARVTAKLAGNLKVAATPGMLKLVSSLLDSEDQLATGLSSAKDAGDSNSSGSARIKPRRHDSYVSQQWRRMKERWAVPAELPLTYQDSFPVLGMLVLENLTSDHDNCAEIGRATDLISKITGFMSYNSDNGALQKAVVYSSLSLVRRLSITGGKVGVLLRQELWDDPFLLDNLTGILEDNRSSIKVWEPAMDIIAKLALTEYGRKEIGSNKVIVCKLIHAFLGRYGPTNMHYSQPLRLAAGEALANLAIENSANCSVILKVAGYQLIKDLKDMLWHDKYRYVAASLLQNLCTHSRDKMYSLGANEHLPYALPVVMEKIMDVEGKQMETLIGLASQICSIVPEFAVQSLESHLNVSTFVQKMVTALHANKKPRPEHPRMRRVIVELTISIIELHPHYAAIFREGGMMEALSKIESIPSKVERYRVFLGNTGVVLESGLPLPIIVARAKRLFDFATPRDHPLSLPTN